MQVYKLLSRASVVATAFMAFAAFSQPASAITTDTLLGSSATGNSGDATQLLGLANLLGVDTSLLELVDKQDVNSLQYNGSQFFLDVTPEGPGFFILKFGVGQLGVDDTYFFQNIAELHLLVFENSQVNNLIKIDDLPDGTRLSHYTLVNQIPLPASLPLLLAGLAGLGILTRRRRAA